MENKLICIGEVLIDFTALENGLIKDVSAFQKNPGGAPANVCACVSKLGKKTMMISKLGQDGFGDFLVETLEKLHIDTSQIVRTTKYKTPLAFVSLREDGERDFAFYRNPSSDLYLDSEEISEEAFQTGDILHFGSVDLADYPVRFAHRKALAIAKEKKLLISFDPNLRFSLWPDTDDLKETVWNYIPYAHVLKLSVEELYFLTDGLPEDKAVKNCFVGNVDVVFVTKGKNGAACYLKNGEMIEHPGFPTQPIDTTGAGDAFSGAILYQMLEDEKNPSNLLSNIDHFERYLSFANKVSSIVVTRYGAMNSMPSLTEIIDLY